MDQECHEEGHLLSVVVSDKTNWLHVSLPVITCQHTDEKSPLVLFEAFHDFTLIDSVEDNVGFYDFCIHKHLNIEFFFE